MTRICSLLAFILCMAPNLLAQQRQRQACPDLSGHYMIQGEDGQVHLYIEQRACDRIVIERRNSYLGKITTEKHSLVLDGKPQADMAWLGQSGISETSAQFDGQTLRIITRVTSAGTQPTMTWNYSLTAGRNLLEDLLSDGRRSGGPLEATRQ